MRKLVGFLIAACVIIAGRASAGETAVGLGAGYVDPSDIGGTAWFTGNVRIKVAESVAVEPEVGYWKKTESIPGLLDVSVEDINVGANVLYLVPAGDKVVASLGGGIGAHFLKGAVGALGFEESDTETKFGGNIQAGLDLKVAENVALFANARYDLVSDFNQFKVYGGVRFGF